MCMLDSYTLILSMVGQYREREREREREIFYLPYARTIKATYINKTKQLLTRGK